MQPKEIKFSSEARQEIFDGIDLFAKTVGVTLGPRGRNVIYDKSFAVPTVTKDGVTVAKEIDLEGFQDLGCRLVREAAAKTSDTTGDGTTTATVLTRAILKEGIRLVAAGHDPKMIKSGIDQATEYLVEYLMEKSKTVKTADEIYKIAKISSNGDEEIAAMIAEALDKVGQDGVITVEESQSISSYLDVIEGIKIDAGYMSPAFLKTEVNVVLEHPYVLVTDQKIQTFKAMESLLNQIIEEGQSLLVVCDDATQEALSTLIFNNSSEILTSCAIRGPGVGEKKADVIKDIAILTGATPVSRELGLSLSDLTLSDLGRADKVIIGRKDTMILGGRGQIEDIELRINEIKALIRKSWSEFDIERFQDRLGRLVGGIGIIKIGAATEIELKEKKARVEDALNATQAAIESGVLPGGGTALFRAGQTLPIRDNPGFNLMKKVCEVPLRKIVENSGIEGSEVVYHLEKTESFFYGYNAESRIYEDLEEVIDPANVVIQSLRNAASIGGMLLTTEAAIINSRS